MRETLRPPRPCRLFPFLARKAQKAVVLRRGPVRWVELIAWDTRRDRFERGQWFRGRVYEDRCDLSPDGGKFIYFAAKFGRLYGARKPDADIPESWTAISKPPYFTALALWPHGSTWGGGGLFLDDTHFWNCDWKPLHPKFSLGRLRPVQAESAGVDFDAMWKGDREIFRLQRDGWQALELRRKRPVRFAKPHPRRSQTLVMDCSEKTPAFQLQVADQPAVPFPADWADWDQNGRLVAAQAGKILAGEFNRHKTLRFEVLADFSRDEPEPLAAPAWAQRW